MKNIGSARYARERETREGETIIACLPPSRSSLFFSRHIDFSRACHAGYSQPAIYVILCIWEKNGKVKTVFSFSAMQLCFVINACLILNKVKSYCRFSQPTTGRTTILNLRVRKSSFLLSYTYS